MVDSACAAPDFGPPMYLGSWHRSSEHFCRPKEKRVSAIDSTLEIPFFLWTTVLCRTDGVHHAKVKYHWFRVRPPLFSIGLTTMHGFIRNPVLSLPRHRLCFSDSVITTVFCAARLGIVPEKKAIWLCPSKPL